MTAIQSHDTICTCLTRTSQRYKHRSWYTLSHREARDTLKFDEFQNRRGPSYKIFRGKLQRLRRTHVLRVAESHALPIYVQLDR